MVLMAGCAVAPSMPSPISISSGTAQGPLVLASAEYSLKDDRELNSYPPVQYLLNALMDPNDTTSRVISIFLPQDSITPGTLLILICDNTRPHTVFFTLHFDHTDSQRTRVILGGQTYMLIYGFDHQWRQFDLE
jgi:hypothetical protein